MKSDLIDVEVHLHHETERAFLVSLDGDRDDAVWIPKLVVELERPDPSKKIWVLTGPGYLLTDKGLV